MGTSLHSGMALQEALDLPQDSSLGLGPGLGLRFWKILGDLIPEDNLWRETSAFSLVTSWGAPERLGRRLEGARNAALPWCPGGTHRGRAQRHGEQRSRAYFPVGERIEHVDTKR